MMDDDGLTRYDSGNPSKDFFGKDRYIQYVSSEASGIPDDEEDDQHQSMMYQPQSMMYQPQSMLYQPQSMLYQPQSMMYQPQSMMYQPQSMMYQPTEYVAANALYKSRALLEELHNFELGKAAPTLAATPTFVSPAATPTVVPPAATPTFVPPVVPPVVPPAATPTFVPPVAAPTFVPPVVPPAATPTFVPPAATPTFVPPAAAPTFVPPAATPEATPTFVSLDVPPAVTPAATPTFASPALTPAATPASAVKATLMDKLNQATAEEKKCEQEPLKQVTIDDRVCNGECGKGTWNKKFKNGENAAWCYTTTKNTAGEDWGFCNPYTMKNSCTSKNLYTLSRVEEYMDSKEYYDAVKDIDDSKVTRETEYIVLKHVAEHVQGAFCDITAPVLSTPGAVTKQQPGLKPKEGKLVYRLCDESSDDTIMYNHIMKDIDANIKSKEKMLQNTKFFDLNTIFPTKNITRTVWAIALHLLPINRKELFRLIVKRYNRVTKFNAEGDGNYLKPALALGFGALFTVAALANSTYGRNAVAVGTPSIPDAAPESAQTSVFKQSVAPVSALDASPGAESASASGAAALYASSGAESASAPGSALDALSGAESASDLESLSALDASLGAESASDLEPVSAPEAAPVSEPGAALEAESVSALKPVPEPAPIYAPAALGADKEIEVDEVINLGDLDEYQDSVGVVINPNQQVATSIALVGQSPNREVVDTDTANTIASALTTGDYTDIMNALPTIQATTTPQSIQLAVAQTATFNVATNPGAANILATALSNLYQADAAQLTSSWFSRLFNTLTSSPEKALVVQKTADVCEAASALYALPPVTHQAPTLLLSCNALETALTVGPRVEANVDSALKSMEASLSPLSPNPLSGAVIPELCNLAAKFPVYIYSNIVQSLLSFAQSQPAHAEPIQRAMSTVALAQQSPSPVFVPHLAELSVAQPLASFSNQLSTAAVKTAAFGLSAATALAAFTAFVPLGVYKVVAHYLTSPSVVAAASTPTMVSRIHVMKNPYCTYMSRWDTRLRQALESNESVDKLVYNETSETCSMLYSLVGREAPQGAKVADAIAAVQAQLPLEPDYTLHAAAFQAQATFIENVTATDNAELIQATQALLLSMPNEQAERLEAVKTAVNDEVKESFMGWQSAQTILVSAHQNGTLSKDMIAPIGELYTSFVSMVTANAEAQLPILNTSALIHQSMVTTAQTVLEQAQALSTPSNAPLSGLMLSETPSVKPVAWDDLSKPNWLQRTCNLASKNMTDSAEGPLVVDVLPTKIVPVPNLNSPWTLVPRDSAFVGVARVKGNLTWVNATCTALGGVTMTETEPPTEKAATFMAQCPMVVEEKVPDMKWNVTADFTIEHPEALKQEMGKQPACVFVPYSWALPSNAGLNTVAKQFFEKVYSHITFEFEDKPTALAMKNTVAPLVASAGIGSLVSSTLSKAAGFALVYMVAAISESPSPFNAALDVLAASEPEEVTPLKAQQRRMSILKKRLAELDSAKHMLLSANPEIKELDQFSKTYTWILSESDQTIAQIKSAEDQLARMVGGGPMARVKVLL